MTEKSVERSYSLPTDLGLIAENADEVEMDQAGHSIVTEPEVSGSNTPNVPYHETTVVINGQEVPWSKVLAPTAQV